MKALIVEDERMAQEILKKAITTNFNDIEIVGVVPSVKATLEWFSKEENTTDIVFMDVELLDGSCFDIFRQIEIDAKVIMTTAYDKYAVRAFEVGSVDYLLKPIETSALKRAVDRCRKQSTSTDIQSVLSAMQNLQKAAGTQSYRRRFIVHIGQRLIPIDISEISYFYAEGKSKYIVTREGHQYFVESSMDSIMEELDPRMFFQISRNNIIASSAIKNIDKLLGGRLKVIISSKPDVEVIVSRSRVNDFLAWLV
ncbi:MAG: LytTR family DNA-binding domain-containing protein [Bacteroidales bacterium]|nr:LytTR family DNA-binding domain-containing protein [Bacteroidales bacterium]